ncbi:MAG: ParA family protein [Anaerolineales bacterium]|nr:ParA family protein [Anaerolineales bacterium]
MSMNYTIAIANEKGGVAKTTTAVSLAGALVQMGKRILVVDLDPQSNLTLALGHIPHHKEMTIASVLLNSEKISNAITQTQIENLDLVPSNSELGVAERFLPVRKNYDTILKNSLGGFLDYDYIIFDCPPALGAVTLNALTAANLLIIPTQAEYFSAYALKNMMAAIRQVRSQNNPMMIYRILVTMYDSRIRAHRTLHEQLITTFGKDGLLETIVEIDTKLRESPIIGIPIMHYVSKSRSALQYRALAEELIENVGEMEEKTFA